MIDVCSGITWQSICCGYDVELDSTATIDVENQGYWKCRRRTVPFEMGHLLRVNSIAGAPKENETLTLKSQFKADTGGQKVIGQAGDLYI